MKSNRGYVPDPPPPPPSSKLSQWRRIYYLVNLLVHRDYRHPISVLPTTSSAPVDTWVDQILGIARGSPDGCRRHFVVSFEQSRPGLTFSEDTLPFTSPVFNQARRRFGSATISDSIVGFVNKIELDFCFRSNDSSKLAPKKCTF